MEQVEHMPYHKERVAYFRWMYNKDPGHQYAKLGPLPPRAEVDPDCPCPADLQGQKGVPGSTESLWRDGVPMPVDPSVFAPQKPAPPTGFAPQSSGAAPQGPSVTQQTPVAAPSSGGQAGDVPPTLPQLQLPLPPLPPLPSDTEPLNTPVPPTYGPTAQDWGDFRVMGGFIGQRPNGSLPVVPPPAGGKVLQLEHQSTQPRGEWLLLR
jgi:hypothetical protein